MNRAVSTFLAKATVLALAAVVAMSATVSATAAQDARIAALTKDMDCTAYRLSETRQRIPLTSKNTIPGAPSAWALLNEGPSHTMIFASNGEEVPLRVFSGKIEIFIGDERYSYSVGLHKSGSAIVRVCR